MAKRRWIALITATIMVAVQFVPQMSVDGTTTRLEDIEPEFRVTVSDMNNNYTYDIETDGSEEFRISGGTDEKDFSIGGRPPLLQGNPYLRVDIAENALIESVTYKITRKNESGTTEIVRAGDVAVDSKSQLYPDVEKSKRGFLTAQHYDVSSLSKYSSDGSTAVNADEWKDRANVFATPFSDGTVYKSARIATQFTSGSAAPFYTYRTHLNGNRFYSTNTVFMYGMVTEERTSGNNYTILGRHAEASKIWGYIQFPDVTQAQGSKTYYLGSISDDGCRVMIIDDRADSPNKDSITDGNEIIINDNFDPHWFQFNTTNKAITVRHEDNGRFFPIYIEYFNYGGEGMFVLLYSDGVPFIRTQVNHVTWENNNNVFISNRNEIRNVLGNRVDVVGENWFYPSKSNDPASEPTAKFQSTARDGIELPSEDGLYYVTVTEKLVDGTERTVTLGPFLIDNTRPDAFIAKLPSNFTSGNVRLQLTITHIAAGATATVESVVWVRDDGAEETLSTANSLSYDSAKYNGKYKFNYKVSNVPDYVFSAEVDVTEIDRVAPVLSARSSAVFNADGTVNRDKAMISVRAADLPGSEGVPTGYKPFSASGAVSIVSIRKNGANVPLVSISDANSGATEHVWNFEADAGAEYTVVVEDLVKNSQTVTVTAHPYVEPSFDAVISDVELSFAASAGDKLQVVENGRFQAKLGFNVNTNIFDKSSGFKNSSINIEFGDADPLEFTIKNISGTGSKWFKIGSDGKSLKVINGMAMGTNRVDLTLVIDIGEKPALSNPGITIGAINVKAVYTVVDEIYGVEITEPIDDSEVHWLGGEKKILGINVVGRPKIK